MAESIELQTASDENVVDQPIELSDDDDGTGTEMIDNDDFNELNENEEINYCYEVTEVADDDDHHVNIDGYHENDIGIDEYNENEEDHVTLEYVNGDGIQMDLLSEIKTENADEDGGSDDNGSVFDVNLENGEYENEDDDDDDDSNSQIKYQISNSNNEYNTTKRRKFKFEKNPRLRRKQQRRLLQVLSDTIYEYTHRVGHQAVILVASPEYRTPRFSVFGARPLRNIVEKLKDIVMEELKFALRDEPTKQHDRNIDESIEEPIDSTEQSTPFELPPLEIDGMPVPVERMTQSQLRAFIPLMLKYSTGRGKPGWGRESTRPKWWPKDLPWANVRMDVRTDDEKQKICWTDALRKMVRNCYRFHGRSDLLPEQSTTRKRSYEPDYDIQQQQQQQQNQSPEPVPKKPVALFKVINDNNTSFITMKNGTLANIQTVALPQNTIVQSSLQPNESEANEPEDTIDLTDDPDDLPVENQIKPQATLPMVVIPQQQTIAAALPQQRIMNLSQLPSNNVIYLTPANKHNNTNYITFPASQLLNAGTKQPNILQVIRLAE